MGKIILNGVEYGSAEPVIDEELSLESKNAVQNKVVSSALNGKANSSHKHTKSEITDFPTSMPANGGNSSTVNGHTVNSDVPEDAKFTDTNTWRGIQDNLTSEATDESLSAAQGKVLKELVDTKTTLIYDETEPSSPENNVVWVG